MKVIILAAGYATRLYPLTKDMPKSLLTVNNKTILDYIVDEINILPDIKSIYLVSNHKFHEKFSKWAEERKNKIDIKVIDDGSTSEYDRRGAIGDIFFALQSENIDEDIMVIAGDNLFTFKLIDYYNYFKSINKDCVCVKNIEDEQLIKQYGVALIDENNKVLDIEEKPEKPKSNIAVFAVYFFLKNTIPLFKEYLESGNKKDAPGYFTQWLCKNKELYAYKFHGECYDIGTHKSYEQIQEKFK